MTLVARVESRFPVAVTALYGTLDYSTVVDLVVTLRDCLAQQPVLLVLDAGHLEVPTPAAARPLAGLVQDARRWPGTRVAVAAARPAVRGTFAALLPEDAIDFYPRVDQARTAGEQMPVPPSESADLAPDRDAPATAREVVAQACQQWGLDRWSGLTQLLTSELVTNAVVHARTSMTLRVRHLDQTLQVAVRDRDPRLVVQTAGEPGRLPADEPGRGLLLLSTLADDWGCAPTGDGKVTWASVRLA